MGLGAIIAYLFYIYSLKKMTFQRLLKKILSNKLEKKGIVTKFDLKINNKIKVKIITGNLFKKN